MPYSRSSPATTHHVPTFRIKTFATDSHPSHQTKSAKVRVHASLLLVTNIPHPTHTSRLKNPLPPNYLRIPQNHIHRFSSHLSTSLQPKKMMGAAIAESMHLKMSPTHTPTSAGPVDPSLGLGISPIVGPDMVAGLDLLMHMFAARN